MSVLESSDKKTFFFFQRQRSNQLAILKAPKTSSTGLGRLESISLQNKTEKKIPLVKSSPKVIRPSFCQHCYLVSYKDPKENLVLMLIDVRSNRVKSNIYWIESYSLGLEFSPTLLSYGKNDVLLLYVKSRTHEAHLRRYSLNLRRFTDHLSLGGRFFSPVEGIWAAKDKFILMGRDLEGRSWQKVFKGDRWLVLERDEWSLLDDESSEKTIRPDGIHFWPSNRYSSYAFFKGSRPGSFYSFMRSANKESYMAIFHSDDWSFSAYRPLHIDAKNLPVMAGNFLFYLDSKNSLSYHATEESMNLDGVLVRAKGAAK